MHFASVTACVIDRAYRKTEIILSIIKRRGNRLYANWNEKTTSTKLSFYGSDHASSVTKILNHWSVLKGYFIKTCFRLRQPHYRTDATFNVSPLIIRTRVFAQPRNRVK